mmetsp:Transcript_37271/g.111615  ORF Transcript_37271/g.111615 Transcript_37271/m.111615 type:complete len:311 (-) Transcript_37271:150-1082(-)
MGGAAGGRNTGSSGGIGGHANNADDGGSERNENGHKSGSTRSNMDRCNGQPSDPIPSNATAITKGVPQDFERGAAGEGRGDGPHRKDDFSPTNVGEIIVPTHSVVGSDQPGVDGPYVLPRMRGRTRRGTGSDRFGWEGSFASRASRTASRGPCGLALATQAVREEFAETYGDDFDGDDGSPGGGSQGRTDTSEEDAQQGGDNDDSGRPPQMRGRTRRGTGSDRFGWEGSFTSRASRTASRGPCSLALATQAVREEFAESYCDGYVDGNDDVQMGAPVVLESGQDGENDEGSRVPTMRGRTRRGTHNDRFV